MSLIIITASGNTIKPGKSCVLGVFVNVLNFCSVEELTFDLTCIDMSMRINGGMIAIVKALEK